MLSLLRVIHLVGLAMFLGSILTHITAGLLPGAGIDPSATLFARQEIDLATRAVTMPGLVLAILSGSLMTAMKYRRLSHHPWLIAHAVTGMAVVVIAVVVMVPTGRSLLDAAAAIALRPDTAEAFNALAPREHGFGAVNIFLTLVGVVLGVVKPSFARN